ncbi:MAG: hypothetical protein ACK5BX_20665, partial [Bradyrhizobium sp.]
AKKAKKSAATKSVSKAPAAPKKAAKKRAPKKAPLVETPEVNEAEAASETSWAMPSPASEEHETGEGTASES